MGPRLPDLPRPGPAMVVGLLLFVGPLAIGGVHLPVSLGLAGAAVLAFLWQAIRSHRRSNPLKLGWLGVGLLFLLVWTTLQWVPLPSGLVEALSPGSAAARQATAEIFGVAPPGWHPLSFDGPRTAAALVTLLGLWSVLVTVANVGSQDRKRLAWTLIAVAAAVALVGVVQKLTGATRILGIYEPSVKLASQYLPTTFVNPNHAAALMLVGSTVAFGQWIENKGERGHHRYLWIALGLALAIAATGSRANMLLVGGALISVGWIGWRVTEEEHERMRIVRVLVGGAAMALMAVTVLASGPWVREMISIGGAGAESEVARWMVGLRVASAYPGVGVGHGAFPVASTDRMDTWDGGWVTFAHNLELQAVADWGLTAAAIGAGLLALGLVAALAARPMSMSRASAAVALCALVVQNQVDFSLLIPGVGYAAAALTGFVVADMRAPAAGGGRWLGTRIRVPFPATTALIVLGVASLATYHALVQSHTRWDGEIRAALAEQAPGRIPLQSVLMAHPNDFHLAIAGSLVAEADGKPEIAAALGERAVRLAPFESTTLLSNATTAIEQHDVVRAMDILHRLSALGNGPLREATAVVLDHRDVPGLVEAFLARDERHVVSTMAMVANSGSPEAALTWTRWALERFPRSVLIRERLATFLLHYARDKADELDRLSVEMLAMGASEANPKLAARLKRTAYLVQGTLLRNEGQHYEAWHMFVAAARLDPSQDRIPLLEQARTLLHMDQPNRLREVLSRLEERLGDEPYERTHYHRLMSHMAERRGETRLAIREMQRALVYRDDATNRQRLASLYRDLGDGAAADRILGGPGAGSGD